jgi:hypothetical protein
MKTLRPKGNKTQHNYVIDEIKIDNGQMIWKDRKVTKTEWEQNL